MMKGYARQYVLIQQNKDCRGINNDTIWYKRTTISIRPEAL